MEKQGHSGGLVFSSPVTLVKIISTQFSFFMLPFIFQLDNFVMTFRIVNFQIDSKIIISTKKIIRNTYVCTASFFVPQILHY